MYLSSARLLKDKSEDTVVSMVSNYELEDSCFFFYRQV